MSIERTSMAANVHVWSIVVCLLNAMFNIFYYYYYYYFEYFIFGSNTLPIRNQEFIMILIQVFQIN